MPARLTASRLYGATLVAASLLLAACGGSGADRAAATDDSRAQAKVSIDLLETSASGTAGELPKKSPAPASDKTVWYVSCGSAIEACRRAGEQMVVAGKVLGWTVEVFDGQLNPSVWNQGIQQATVAGADAIITGAVDCPAVSQSLAAATAKGILTLSVFSYDCDDQAFGKGGKPLYQHLTETGPGATMADTALLMGKLQAAWAIRDSSGTAKVIQFMEDDQAVVGYIGKGFSEQMETCSTCETVATVKFGLADLGPNLVQKARTALLKNPAATYVVAPTDTSAALLNQAVTQAGKAEEVKVLGTLGDAQNVSVIESGGPQVMSVGIDTGWLGWAAIDDLVRIFADEKPVYSGWSVGIVDSDNLPEGEIYHAPVEYEDTYRKIWGKS